MSTPATELTELTRECSFARSQGGYTAAGTSPGSDGPSGSFTFERVGASESVTPLSVYQLEYSRNLVFADGATMQRVFDTVVDRTRSRLDVPKIRTVFGTAQRPRRTRKQFLDHRGRDRDTYL